MNEHEQQREEGGKQDGLKDWKFLLLVLVIVAWVVHVLVESDETIKVGEKENDSNWREAATEFAEELEDAHESGKWDVFEKMMGVE